MVLRIGRITKISFRINPNRVEYVKKLIETKFPNEYKIYSKKNEITISGDFSNYKKRNKLIYLLSGGKIGENI